MINNEDHSNTIARSHGVSCDAASFLLGLTDEAHDVTDLDEDGREWLLWLLHRGLVQLEDSMGRLYFRISRQGARVAAEATTKDPRYTLAEIDPYFD